MPGGGVAPATMSLRSMRVLRAKRSRIIAVVVAVLVIGFVVLTVVALRQARPQCSGASRRRRGARRRPTSGRPTKRYGWSSRGTHPRWRSPCPPGLLASGPEVKQVDARANVVCFAAEPQTTQGEARSIRHLASMHHWKRVIVVMPIPQASRARLRVGRCLLRAGARGGGGAPGFVGLDAQIVYEWGAMVKALVLQPTC